VNDSWSSEPPSPPSRPDAIGDAQPEAEHARRSDRYGEAASEAPAADARRERHPWVGLAFLVVGLIAGAVALGLIARDLERPGVAEIEPALWWAVLGGGVAIAWAAPWFLRRRNRRRMAIGLAVCTAVVVGVAAVAIGGLDS
jgi:hypothetical protein